MLESIINPKRAEKGPWKMFFVGLVYASLSLLLVHLFFGNDYSLSNASGMIVVAFCLMFTLPFMYYIIKIEEEQDEKIEGVFKVWETHRDAVYAFMFLFLGFVLAFSFWNIVLHDPNLLNFQVKTYCQINSPGNIENCVTSYSAGGTGIFNPTGAATREMRLLSIISNNVNVMIFCLIFSLIFGAGAIFVLIWNASVIAAAVGIFSKYNLADIPLALSRYMIHGLPEIVAYFITALAGAIFGVGIIRHGFKSRKTFRVIGNVVALLLIAIIILVLAALVEVYITPAIFG